MLGPVRVRGLAGELVEREAVRGEDHGVRAPVRGQHLGARAGGDEARERQAAAELEHARARRAAGRRRARGRARSPLGHSRAHHGTGRPANASSSRRASQSAGRTTWSPRGSETRTATSRSGAGSDVMSTPRRAASRSASDVRRAASAAVISLHRSRPRIGEVLHNRWGVVATGAAAHDAGHGTDALRRRPRTGRRRRRLRGRGRRARGGRSAEAEHRARPRRRPGLEPLALHARGAAPPARRGDPRALLRGGLAVLHVAREHVRRPVPAQHARPVERPADGRLPGVARARRPAPELRRRALRRRLPDRDVRQVPQRLPGRSAARPGVERLAGGLGRLPRLRLRLLRQRHARALRRRPGGLRDRRHRPCRRPVHPRLGRGGRAVHGPALHVHAAPADGAGAPARDAPPAGAVAAWTAPSAGGSATRRDGSERAAR